MADVGARNFEDPPTVDLARPSRRRARVRRAVRAADRGRPADRPRRLRHEGRARGDDVRGQATSPTTSTSASASSASPTRSPRTSTSRSTDVLVAGGLRGDFAITGEPTDLHIGIQAKGVLAVRVERQRRRGARLDAVAGRQRDPQGPRRLPPDRDAALQPRVLRPLRPPVDQPRADRGRRRLQQGPRPLHDGRRHPLPARPGPGRDPRPDPRDPRPRGRQVLHARARGGRRAATRTCARCARASAARSRARRCRSGATAPPTRSRSSRPAIPAVEFGPVGGGHHGPEEWVSIASLRRYRQALTDFVALLPAWLEREGTDGPDLHAVEGGLA